MDFSLKFILLTYLIISIEGKPQNHNGGQSHNGGIEDKRYLILGGWTVGTDLDTEVCSFFCLSSSSSLSPFGDIPSKRTDAVGGLLGSTPILCGGFTNTFEDSCISFKNSQWTKTHEMTTKRAGAASVQLNSTTMWILGGHNSDGLDSTEFLTDFNLQGSTGTKIQSNECKTDGSCNGVRFHGPAPPASKGASVSTTTNVQTRRKRAEFNFGKNSKPQILSAECKVEGSCKGLKFQKEDKSTYLDLQDTKNNNIQVSECQEAGSCNGVSFNRRKRSDFNFDGNYDVNLQTNRCTGSGCDTTLSNIRNSESHAVDQSGINAMSQQSGDQTQNNTMPQSETQNIPVQEGEIVQAGDEIRYKAYLYNTHL